MSHRSKGIKLIAHLPISKTTVVGIGSQPDQGAAEILIPEIGKTTHFLVRQGYFNAQQNPINVDFDVYGKGFKYDSLFPGAPQVPIDGVIKAMDVWVDNQLGLELSGLFLPVPKASKLLGDDPFSIFAELLVGDDIVIGSAFDDLEIWSGKGNDQLWGRFGVDILDGHKGNDVSDGGEGNDQLIDTKGEENTFQFSTPLQLGAANFGVNFDTIKKLRSSDEVYLKYDIFPAAGMEVSKGELAFASQAQDGNDYFLFFNNVFWYDGDANGPGEATPIFQTLNDAKLTHKMIEIGVSGDFY